MALIKSLNGMKPEIDEDCYLAETAALIGEVKLEKGVSIWFGAVLRGDVGAIHVGENSNVQDNAVIHSTKDKSVAEIGQNVTIGHGAIIHGAQIDDFVLIGMGAIVMDNARVGEGATIAAGAVVLANTLIEPYTLWAGVPAKFVKRLNPELAKKEKEISANNYGQYSEWYK